MIALPVTADDPDGDNVTINVTSVLPGWVTVDNTNNNRDPATILLKGTTLVSHIGKRSDPPTFTFTVTATDGVNTSPPVTANVYVTRFKESFVPGSDTADTQTVDFADVDGDGDLDILTATPGIHHAGVNPSSVTVSPTEYIRLYRNNGNGTFTDISDVLGANIPPDPPGGSGCFLAGTPVLLPDGTTRPIEALKVGDKVLAFDAESKTFKEDTVKEFFEHDADHYLVVNGHLKVTPNHPVYSDGKWVQIGSLNVGGSLVDSEGKPLAIASIQEIREKVKVYNLEINPYHTYIAGGVVVHNRKVIPELAGEPSENPAPESQLQTTTTEGEPLVMPRRIPADTGGGGGPGISPEQRWRGMSARFLWLDSGILPDILIVHRGTDHAVQSVNQGEYVILQNDGAGRFDSTAYPPIRKTLHGASDIAFFYSHPNDEGNRSQWAFLLANSGSSTLSANSRIFDKDRIERTTHFPPPGPANDPECISEAGVVAVGDINSDGDQDLFLGGFSFYDQSGVYFQTSGCRHNGFISTHPAKDRRQNSRLFGNAGAASGEVGDLTELPFTDPPWPSTVPTDPAGYNWFNLFRYERKADLKDVDLDGSLDLIVADPTPKAPAAYGNAIFLNSGSGNFTHVPGRLNWQVYRDADVEVGDLDLVDSGGFFFPEIIYVPWKGEIRALKTVDSGAWYEENTKWDFPQNPLGDINNALKLGDLDNDGDLDLYLAKDAADRIYFNMTCTPASPCLPARDADFISQTVPTTMNGGQTYSVSLTFQNKGTTAWSQASNFKLGSQNPQDNFTWGLNRVLFGAGSVTTGQYKTFTFNVTAPTTPGTYNFQWQMLQEGVAWFGERSTNVSVTVGSPPSIPVANPQSVTLNEDAPPLDIYLTGSDAGNDYPLAFSIVSNPSKGTLSAVTNLPDGISARVAYDSNLNENGPDSFTFRVTDTNGDVSSPATVSITINPVNDPPIVNAGPDQTLNVTSRLNNPVPVNLSGSAVDPEGSPIAFYRWTEGAITLGSGPSITYSFNPGSHVVSLEASDGTAIGIDNLVVTIEAYPQFTAPTPDELEQRVDPGDDSFEITVTATDRNRGLTPGPGDDDNVTLSIVGTYPSWLQSFTAPTPANQVSFTFRARPGRPNASDVGTHILTVRATDDSPQLFDTDIQITLHVNRFVDVSQTNIPQQTTRTLGIDAADIDGDGDKDLIIGHPLSSSQSADPEARATRVWLNSGGVFTDRTYSPIARLKDSQGNSKVFYSRAVKIARRDIRGPLDLFLTEWKDKGTGDKQEHSKGFWLENNNSGVFQDGLATVSWSYTVAMGEDLEVTSKYMYDPVTRRNEWCHLTFFGNGGLGEFKAPNAEPNDGFLWKYPFCAWTYVDCPMSGRSGCAPFKDGGTTIEAISADVELADFDGDGVTDVLTAGAAYYDYGTPANPAGPIVPSYADPLKLFLGTAGANDYYYRTLANNTLPANYNNWWAATWNPGQLPGSETGPNHRGQMPDSLVMQRAEAADFNVDGKVDIVFVDPQNGVKVYRNTRTGTGAANLSFSLVTFPALAGPPYLEAREVEVGNIVGDSKPDILLLGWGPRPVKVFENISSGATIAFQEVDVLPMNNGDSERALIFDMDGDGDMDIYIGNKGLDTLIENMTN